MSFVVENFTALGRKTCQTLCGLFYLNMQPRLYVITRYLVAFFVFLNDNGSLLKYKREFRRTTLL